MLKTTYRMCLARKCELYDITCQHVLDIEGYIKFETNHLNHNINNITAIFLNMEVTNYPFWDTRGRQKLITSRDGYEILE